MTGRVFGKLTVVEFGDFRGKMSRWKCLCECGNTTVVYSNALRRGLTKSCGCSRSTKRDLTGQVFGRLTVVRDSGERRFRAAVWECRCGCGTTTFVKGQTLTSGSSRSCGCLQKELAAEKKRIHGLVGTPGYKKYIKAKYRAAMTLRTPPWADLDAIRVIYAKCPEGYHVDHDIPLQGDLVCGLHVAENLQYLPPYENVSKGKKFTPQFITNWTPDPKPQQLLLALSH